MVICKLKLIFLKYEKIGTTLKKKNNSVALNMLSVNNWDQNNIEINQNYISENNSQQENQIMLLMITVGKTWHYLGVTKSSALDY